MSKEKLVVTRVKSQTPYQYLNLRYYNAVAEICLNRPEVMNAFSIELATELGRALKQVAQNKKVRAVVIRGAGKAFSAGGDLKKFYAALPKVSPLFSKVSALLNTAIQSIRNMSKPVIAGVHGPAFAAAFGLTLACDVILASESAKFSASYSNIALCPNASASIYLPRIVGFHRANELFFTGRELSAREAYEWGIVNRLVKDEDFEIALQTFAEELSKRPTRTLGRTKLLLNKSLGFRFELQLNCEKEAIAWSSTTPDFAEGVTAFVEKRNAVFTGL